MEYYAYLMGDIHKYIWSLRPKSGWDYCKSLAAGGKTMSGKEKTFIILTEKADNKV